MKKLFHLSLDIRLTNGKIIKLEKNARISITQIHSIDGNSNNDYNITLPNVTLNEFINNGYKQMKEKFFMYDAAKSNCQDFLIGLLRGSQALTPEAEKFIKQDTQHLFENMYNTQAMMNRITDLAGKLDIIAQGGNVPDHIQTYHQFARYYYETKAKHKRLTYKQMIQSSEFKHEYMLFKQTKK